MSSAAERIGREISRSTWLLVSLTIVSLALNVGWNVMLASHFGLSGALDAFWIGLAVPKAIADSFHLGLLMLLFMVVFSRWDSAETRVEAWRLASAAINVVVLATAVIIVLLLIFAPVLVRIMGPGLEAAQRATAVATLRYLSPMLLLTVVTGAVLGILNAQRNFFPFAIARMLGLTAQIGILALLDHRLGVGPAVAGLLGGAAVMTAVSLRYLSQCDFRYVPVLRLRGSDARAIFHLFGALAVFSVGAMVNLASDRFFASLTGPGNVSAFEFASRFEIPVTQIVSISVALPTLAFFALFATQDRMDEFRATLGATLRLAGFLVFPLVVFLVLMRTPLTMLWLGRGAFSAEAVALVASLLPYLGAVFVFRAFSPILLFGLFSLGRIRIVLYMLVGEILLNALLNAWWSAALGVRGVALATAVSMAIANAVLWSIFARAAGGLPMHSYREWALKSLVCNLGAAAVVILLRWAVGVEYTLGAPLWTLGETASFGLVFGISYAIFANSFGLIQVRLVGRVPRISVHYG